MVAYVGPSASHLDRSRAHLAINALRAFDPPTAARLHTYYEYPTVDYLGSMFDPVPRARCKTVQHARDLFFDTLRNWFCTALREDDLTRLIDELDSSGVIQMGPHCELCLNNGQFFGSIMPLLGAQRRDLKFVLAFACATVKFEQNSKRGPGWLQSHDTNINIFDKSRSVLKNSNVISSSGGFTFEFRAEQHLAALEERLSALRELFKPHGGMFVADAVHAANATFLQRVTSKDSPAFLYIDERFFSRLMHAHLADRSSLVVDLLFGARKETFLESLAACSREMGAVMIPNQTSFFWRVAGRKLRALTLDRNALVDRAEPEVRFSWSRAAIQDLLLEGKLLPSLFCVYLTGVLLTGFRALGGFFQMAYLAAFRMAILQDLQDRSPDDPHLACDLAKRDFHGLTMGLVPSGRDVLSSLDFPSIGAGSLIDQAIASTTLRECTKELAKLRWHHHWIPLLQRHIASDHWAR